MMKRPPNCTRDDLIAQAGIAASAAQGDAPAATESLRFCQANPQFSPCRVVMEAEATAWKYRRVAFDMLAGYLSELAALLDAAECRTYLDLIGPETPMNTSVCIPFALCV